MSFRDEVNAIAKTPEQVACEKRNESIDAGVRWAHRDYDELKLAIKRKSQSGEYKIVNGKRVISFDFTEGHIRHLVEYRHTWFDGICEKGVNCVANDEVLVNAYKKELNRLSKEDDINVCLKCVFIDHDGSERCFDVPGTDIALHKRNTIHIKNHSRIVLRCTFVL